MLDRRSDVLRCDGDFTVEWTVREPVNKATAEAMASQVDVRGTERHRLNVNLKATSC